MSACQSNVSNAGAARVVLTMTRSDAMNRSVRLEGRGARLAWHGKAVERVSLPCLSRLPSRQVSPPCLAVPIWHMSHLNPSTATKRGAGSPHLLKSLTQVQSVSYPTLGKKPGQACQARAMRRFPTRTERIFSARPALVTRRSTEQRAAGVHYTTTIPWQPWGGGGLDCGLMTGGDGPLVMCVSVSVCTCTERVSVPCN